MKKIISFGKIDFNHSGRKNCKVTIEVELRDTDKGKELSISGDIWNPRETDIYSGGQNLDTIIQYVKTPKMKRIHEIWKRWHLNGLKAGCVHQREMKWNEARIDPKELPNSHSNRDEKGILAIWVYPTEHENGLLTKPCPVCGYKYGSAWLFEELPEEVIKEVESW
jgi:hypothetical protein